MTQAMTQGTTFSVVVTCYNYERFVAEAVDSVLAQTRPALQVIVVDDGSTDGSAQLLRTRYGQDSRVSLIIGANGGQLAAFQRGSAIATGDVICYLDADDRWVADHLAQIGAVYDARPDIDFVFTDVQLFGQSDRRIPYADRALDLGYTVVSTYLLEPWYGAPTSAISMRRTLALRCLDLPEAFHAAWRISADCCLVYGASVLGGRKYFLPTGSMHYRIHGDNGYMGRQRSPGARLFMQMNKRRLIDHYGRVMGLTPDCVNFAKTEFLTKPQAPMREAKRYADLVRRRRGSWWRNAVRALSILRRAWANRADAPVEYEERL